MTKEEFSNEFDILYNSITSNQAPGLDEYEKSVFLTKAQEEIVLKYFNPKSNRLQEGFDGSEKRQIDFSMIIRTKQCTETEKSSSLISLYNYNKGVKFFTFPDEPIMLLLNESLVVTRDDKDISLVVVPITYQELNKVMTKPFKRPIKTQAWRYILDKQTANNNDVMGVQIIAGNNDTIKNYYIRYIKRPNPIILQDISDGGQNELSINGHHEASDCELDPIIHREILQRAVELAKAAYMGDLNTTIQTGNISATDVGVSTPSNNQR